MEIIKDLITVNNFKKGRIGPDGRHWEPDTIVIHVTEGSEAAAESWFDAEVSDVSSNYINSKSGVVKQEVLEEDTAWAQGRVDNPTAKIVLARPGINPNLYCISIEHEGDGTQPLTPEQKISTVWLIRDIVSRRPLIKYDRDHIIGHHEIYSKKTCPGKIDVDEIVRLASVKDTIQNPVIPPTIPRVVWSDFLNNYLVVTKYVSDTEWYFLPITQFGNGQRASEVLSKMKLHP